jgi:uncharacterized protein (TIGR02217 family)
MAFFDVQFPPSIARGAVGGPGYDNDIIAFHNAREVTISNRDNGLGSWDVAHGIKYLSEFDELLQFFRSMRGDANQFRFRDPLDFTLSGELIATGDAATSAWNVTKTYGDGTNDEVRRIYKLVQSPDYTPTAFYLDGTPDSISNWTIDYDNGTVTRTAGAPGASVLITMDGEFDVPARFGNKQMKARWEDYNVVTWGEIMVVEVIPDGVSEAS